MSFTNESNTPNCFSQNQVSILNGGAERITGENLSCLAAEEDNQVNDKQTDQEKDTMCHSIT